MRTPSRPSFPAPVIIPATREDIHDIARIWMAAERPNILAFFEFGRSPEKQAHMADALIRELEANIDRPQILAMKAIDADTKQMTAFALWQLSGYDPKDLVNKNFDANHLKKDEAYHQASFPWANPSQSQGLSMGGGMLLSNCTQEAHRESSALSKYMGSQFEKFMDSWAKETKHIYLAMLMTDPHFQRRGIGTALLDWGHKIADSDKVPAFLIASPVGHPLYQHVGWKDVEKPLEVDLKDWVPYAENGDMGWGTYRLYYMLRMPKTAV